MSQIADQLEVSYKTVQRFMDKLKEAGRIERKGGKRFFPPVFDPLYRAETKL